MDTLPTGVYATYEDTLMRIQDQPEEEAQLAMKALSYIFCAKRPLKVEELLHALAVEIDDTELDDSAFSETEILLGVAAGLVTIDEESNTIRLVHYTLQEYLEKTREKLFPNAESEIAKICLTYLSFDVFKSGPCGSETLLDDRLQKYQFLDYASHNWGRHVREGGQSELTDLVLRYLEDDRRMSCSLQVLYLSKYRTSDWHYQYPKEFKSSHAVAYWGLDKVLAVLVGQDIDINSQDSNGATALHLAAANGHEAAVRLLLGKGANIEAENNHGYTALYEAIKNGHEIIARLLLEKGLTSHRKINWDVLRYSWPPGKGMKR